MEHLKNIREINPYSQRKKFCGPIIQLDNFYEFLSNLYMHYYYYSLQTSLNLKQRFCQFVALQNPINSLTFFSFFPP